MGDGIATGDTRREEDWQDGAMGFMRQPLVNIVVFAPVESADAIRAAFADAGAGSIGEYAACSFSTTGTGRFLPSGKAQPFIGEKGEMTQVEEVRIECVTTRQAARKAVKAMLAAHPYEQPAYHIYPILTLEDL